MTASLIDDVGAMRDLLISQQPFTEDAFNACRSVRNLQSRNIIGEFDSDKADNDYKTVQVAKVAEPDSDPATKKRLQATI